MKGHGGRDWHISEYEVENLRRSETSTRVCENIEPYKKEIERLKKKIKRLEKLIGKEK